MSLTLKCWEVKMDMSDERLPQNKTLAAQLVAAGQMEKQQIAEVVGINRTTLWNWEKDEKFKAEVDRLKREVQDFGEGLIKGRLVEAVKGYWNLIESTDNAMVKKQGYEFFIERSLGKLSTKLEVEANTNESKKVDTDLLANEMQEVDQSVN